MSLLTIGRSTTVTPPPVSSLDSPRKSSPIMVLPASRKSRKGLSTPGSDCLALMWPTTDDEKGHCLSPVSPSIKTHLGGTLMDSCHEHNDMKIQSPHGEGSVSLDKTTEVLLCPSGKTVVRLKASIEAVLPSPSDKGSSSMIKHLSLPYSPSSSSKPSSRSFMGSDSSPYPRLGGIGNSSLNFPGRSLLFDSSEKPSSDSHPPSALSSSPSREISSGVDTPFSSLKKKGPRRRKISGKDKGTKVRFAGGATEILEQDHPEDDLMMTQSRCPCFKCFIIMCFVVLSLSVLFYLSLWIVAQHRGSPVIVAGGESLHSILQSQVFGQSIVVSHLPQLLSGILSKDVRDRTLVLMFHGQSGVGKTFVAELIGNKMFPEEAQSQCVYKFLPSFLEVREHLVTAYDYSIALEDFIDNGKSNYRTCPVGLYIIEDIDYVSSSSLLEAVALTLPGIRTRQAAQEQKMILFLMTNLQSEAVGDYLLSHLELGKNREDITLKELEPVMTKVPITQEYTAESENSEDHDVQRLEVHDKLMAVVDHHIPFLPLERKHVIMCIQQTLTWKNVTLNENDVQWIADKLVFYPENNPVFSMSGCKKVEEKANLFS
nr:uncharacterized protein LOC129277635 [Lytechinus pictus]